MPMPASTRKSIRSLGVSLLSLAVSLALVPPVAAADRVAGSIRVSGPAFAARPGGDWATITAPRPLVAGDLLKTGKDGYLVADMGANGLIGLFGDSEVSTSETADGLIVEVVHGKVAFHLEPKATIGIRIANATIHSGEETADGYVELDSVSPPAVVMEGGTLDVRLPDGGTKTIATGERLELGTTTAVIESRDDRRAAGAASPDDGKKPERRKYAGLSLRGWTAIAVVAAAVAGGAAALAGGGGGGGGGNGSPSGE
jgi:hypothetical protein